MALSSDSSVVDVVSVEMSEKCAILSEIANVCPGQDENQLDEMSGGNEKSIAYRGSSGFSTPPTASIDTCDSGFTDLYSGGGTITTTTTTKPSIKAATKTTQTIEKSSTKTITIKKQNGSMRNYSNRSSSSSGGESTIDTSDSESKGKQLIVEKRAPLHHRQYHRRLYNVQTNDGFTGDLSSESNSNCDMPGTGARLTVDNKELIDEAKEDRNENEDEEEEEEEEDDDDEYDTASNLSRLSELSDVFKMNTSILPEMQRSLNWIHLQIASGVKPRDCLSKVFLSTTSSNGSIGSAALAAAAVASIPSNLSDTDLWRIIATWLSDPPRRERLRNINTIEDVCRLLSTSDNIIVLTGAGVSVSCGIPDFRSRGGIYSRLRREFPEMHDPQSMFDIRYFAHDPRPFYKFAKEIYPGQFRPSPCHRFIRLLEQKQKLLRNYSQNIDTLERVAGIQNVIECHGSFATASCTKCHRKVTADVIRDDIMAQTIPMCKLCNQNVDHANEDYRNLVDKGVMKPDIVFFGESLPDEFHKTVDFDKLKCDLLIVIGSSLKVRPVALIPSSIPDHVPQILINREQLDNFGFDVELLGDSDVIINQLCHMLDDDEFRELCWQPALQEVNELLPAVNINSNQRFTVNSSNDGMNKEILSQTNDLKPETLNLKSETLDLKPATSDLKLETSDLKPENSDLKPENSVLKPETSDLKSETSDLKPETSDLKSEMSDIKQINSDLNIKWTNSTYLRADSTTSSKLPSGNDDVSNESNNINENQTRNRNVTMSKSPHSITERLPNNSYYRDPPNLYIFPGAEIWWNDYDDEDDDIDEDDDDDDDEEDEENENSTTFDNETSILTSSDCGISQTSDEDNEHHVNENSNFSNSCTSSSNSSSSSSSSSSSTSNNSSNSCNSSGNGSTEALDKDDDQKSNDSNLHFTLNLSSDQNQQIDVSNNRIYCCKSTNKRKPNTPPLFIIADDKHGSDGVQLPFCKKKRKIDDKIEPIE